MILRNAVERFGKDAFRAVGAAGVKERVGERADCELHLVGFVFHRGGFEHRGEDGLGIRADESEGFGGLDAEPAVVVVQQADEGIERGDGAGFQLAEGIHRADAGARVFAADHREQLREHVVLALGEFFRR